MGTPLFFRDSLLYFDELLRAFDMDAAGLPLDEPVALPPELFAERPLTELDRLVEVFRPSPAAELFAPDADFEAEPDDAVDLTLPLELAVFELAVERAAPLPLPF